MPPAVTLSITLLQISNSTFQLCENYAENAKIKLELIYGINSCIERTGLAE